MKPSGLGAAHSDRAQGLHRHRLRLPAAKDKLGKGFGQHGPAAVGSNRRGRRFDGSRIGG